MAEKNSAVTKADVLISKVDALTRQTATLDSKFSSALKEIKTGEAETASAVKKLSSAQNTAAGYGDDINYLSAQIQSVYSGLMKAVSRLSQEVEKLKRSGLGSTDCDELASRIAEKIIIPDTCNAEVDCDLIAQKVATKVGLKLLSPIELDYDQLGIKVCEHMHIPSAVAEEIDLDVLAEKLSHYIPAQEVISPDYVASKVAEQIVIPSQVEAGASVSDINIEELSRKIADKIAVPVCDVPEVVVDEDRIATAVAEKLKGEDYETRETYLDEETHTEIDEEALADAITSRLNVSLSDKMIADAVVQNLSEVIDNDEIADRVAKKVGTVSPEQFDVLVDDDGCDSLAKAVEEKLDYDVICAGVAEKLAPAFMSQGGADIDTEELAKTLSEKINVTTSVNEDLIADKAAAALSNYLPEIDTDEIADKVVSGVIPAIPAAPVIDYDGISNSVSEKIVESQEDKDYDIVIDDEGLARITENVSEGIKKEYSERLDKLEESVEEIKRLLLSGVIVAATNNTETAVAEAVYEEPVQEEELVTVSDIVEESEEPEDDETDEVIDEIVDDIDESPADGEVMPDGIPGISGGVDFANMMKYNRSFIARIIQGSDEQKQYYGEVKNALLSYKKVNSNIAWGAERFNKGRETIARFKIRGKTLCLYLALNPADFPESVYHQADVSDNKSMHGTPMMVKIKSPRGVKKAIRLIDTMLEQRNGIKQNVRERDYAAMYPYETIDELIEDGLVKDVSKK